ncbi:hypothetical protein [Dankookia sp. P2]|uniref:hypothetical protein n=1 Tax=Dankookia sp. P2 TaxID=3423955 RepID=UPI003D67C699
MLWQISPEPVLCFDGDGAGARAAARSAELALPLLSPERSLKLATLTGGEDPDTLVRKGGAAAFQPVLDAARPLSVALYDLVTKDKPRETPEQRAALRARLEELARLIPDKMLAGEYRRALLDRFFEAGRRPMPPAAPAARPGRRRAANGGASRRWASPACPGRRSTSPASGWNGPATCSPSCSATRCCCRRSRSR